VVINSGILGHIARQPALPRQAVCIPVVVDGLTCYYSSVKWI